MKNPAFFALLLVPLVLGTKQLTVGDVAYFDVFTWYKAALVCFLGAAAFYNCQPPALAVALIALSCVFSVNPEVAWWGFTLQHFGGAVLIALLALAYNPPNEKDITTALAWGTIPVSILALRPEWMPWHFVAPGLRIEYEGRAASTLFNVDYVGFYAAMVCPLLLAKRKYFSAILTFAMLIQSRNRSGLYATLCGVILLLWLERRYLQAYAGSILTVIGAFVVCVKNPTFSGRFEIWKNTLPLITPLGSGMGTFALQYPQNPNAAFVDKPHNMYLGIAHAFGWVGLAIGFFLFFRYWRPKSKALTVGAISGLIAAFCNDLYVGVAPILVILVSASTRGGEVDGPYPSNLLDLQRAMDKNRP